MLEARQGSNEKFLLQSAAHEAAMTSWDTDYTAAVCTGNDENTCILHVLKYTKCMYIINTRAHTHERARRLVCWLISATSLVSLWSRVCLRIPMDEHACSLCTTCFEGHKLKVNWKQKKPYYLFKHRLKKNSLQFTNVTKQKKNEMTTPEYWIHDVIMSYS